MALHRKAWCGYPLRISQGPFGGIYFDAILCWSQMASAFSLQALLMWMKRTNSIYDMITSVYTTRTSQVHGALLA